MAHYYFGEQIVNFAHSAADKWSRGWNWTGDQLRKMPGAAEFAKWGWRGVGASALEGGLAAGGFFKNSAGKFSFLGGASVGSTLFTGAATVGLGYGVYKATDNPVLGLAAGAGGLWASTRGMKGGMGKGAGNLFKLAAPAFTLHSMYEGYKTEGVLGAAKAGIREAATFAAFDVGFKAVSIAFKGSSLAAAASGVGRLAMNPALLTAVAAGYGIYKGAQALSSYGRRSNRAEFAGSMAAFQNEAAYTMRQRAVSEISRSHTNSRTILGNEAQLLHTY